MKASVRLCPYLPVLFCPWTKTCAALPNFIINSTAFVVCFLAAPAPEVRRLVWECSLPLCLPPLQQCLMLAGKALETLTPGGSRTRRHKECAIFNFQLILMPIPRLISTQHVISEYWGLSVLSVAPLPRLEGRWAGILVAGKVIPSSCGTGHTVNTTSSQLPSRYTGEANVAERTVCVLQRLLWISACNRAPSTLHPPHLLPR